MEKIINFNDGFSEMLNGILEIYRKDKAEKIAKGIFIVKPKKGGKKTVFFRGLGRELYYTKEGDIRLCVKLLLEKEPSLRYLKWHDPFAADGRWAKVVKEFGIECFSSDIKPLDCGVAQMNAFDVMPRPDTLYIGNPPFSKARELVQHFKYKCAFIMQSAAFSLGVKHLWYFSTHSHLYFLTGSGGNSIKVFCFFSYFDESRSDVVIPGYAHLVSKPCLRVDPYKAVPLKDNYYKVF